MRVFAIFLFLTALLHAKPVKITVTGIRNDTGNIAALVFKDAKGFPDQQEFAAKRIVTKAKNGKLTLSIKDLPVGTYAITVIHDENADGKMQTNILGIPREGVGVTNGLGRTKPKFRNSTIKIKPGDTITIALKYF